MDEAVVMRTCRTCGVAKPGTPDFFHRRYRGREGLETRCLLCARRDRNERRRRPAAIASARAYYRRPEVLDRMAAYAREYRASAAGRAKIEAYATSARGKCVRNLGVVRYRIARSADPARLARLRELEAAYVAELARIERALDCERKRGRPPGRRTA